MTKSNHFSEQPPETKGNRTMKKSQIRIWFLIPLIIFAAVMVMLYFRLGQPTEIVTNTALERPVPAFELPLLSDTSRIMTNDNLPDEPNLVGVNYKDDIGDALGYLNRGGDPFSMSIQDLSGQFALDLGLTGAPETFTVDGEGVIRQHIVGEINESNWQDRIEPCLTVLNDANDNNVSPDAIQVEEVCK